jgi:hypothetical protein
MDFKKVLIILLMSVPAFAMNAKEAKRLSEKATYERIDMLIEENVNSGSCVLEFPNDQFAVIPEKIVKHYELQGYNAINYIAAKQIHIDWCEK